MKTIFLSTLICMSSLAYANQNSATSSTLELSREEAYTEPRGVLPFIGAGGGYTGYERAGGVEGTPATLKLLGSWYLDRPWVIDLGYGVNNQQFTQGAAERSAITDGALEFAARYRTDNRWQFGVVANQLYNQGINYAADQGDAHFAGLQLLKEVNVSPSWLMRVGARAMSLTNNTDGLVNMYLVDLQLGWNSQAYRPSARSTASAPAEDMNMQSDEMETTSSRPAMRPVTYQEARPTSPLRDVDYSMLMDTKPIEFSTAATTVSPSDRARLSKLAKVLEDNKDLFEKVEVHGFTDTTGSSAVNQRISQRRADSVRNILRSSGLRDVDIVAMGKGETDSAMTSAGDRRAELVFIGVKDEQALREALSSVE